jgi:hypothetical protein
VFTHGTNQQVVFLWVVCLLDNALFLFADCTRAWFDFGSQLLGLLENDHVAHSSLFHSHNRSFHRDVGLRVLDHFFVHKIKMKKKNEKNKVVKKLSARLSYRGVWVLHRQGSKEQVAARVQGMESPCFFNPGHQVRVVARPELPNRQKDRGYC